MKRRRAFASKFARRARVLNPSKKKRASRSKFRTRLSGQPSGFGRLRFGTSAQTPVSIFQQFSTPSGGTKRMSKKKVARRKALKSSVRKIGLHRPRVYLRKVGKSRRWFRSKRSRLFPRPTRLNAKHRVGHLSRRRRHAMTRYNPIRRHVSRRYRSNPNVVGAILNRQTLMVVGKAGLGITAGFLAMPLVYKILPENFRMQNRKYLGGVNIALGLAVTALLRNQNFKEIGLYIAATGVYDLIASNVPQLGLPALPVSIPILEEALTKTPGAEEPQSASYPVSTLPVSPVARTAVGSSYQSMAAAGYGASFQAPDMKTQGLGEDNPFACIEGYDE